MADETDGLKGLSGRERQILDLLSMNFRSKEIGARLGIHPRTVDNHCINICRKLEVPDRFEAVRLWSVEFKKLALDPEPARTPDDMFDLEGVSRLELIPGLELAYLLECVSELESAATRMHLESLYGAEYDPLE